MSMSIPTVSMQCAYTTNISNPIAVVAKIIPRLLNSSFIPLSWQIICEIIPNPGRMRRYTEPLVWCLRNAQNDPGTHLPLIQWVPLFLSPRVKQLGHEPKHTPISDAMVKIEWCYTSVFPILLHSMHQENLPLPYNLHELCHVL